MTVANVIGVPLATYFGHEYHWSVAFLMVGLVGLVALLSVYFWMPHLAQSSMNQSAFNMGNASGAFF